MVPPVHSASAPTTTVQVFDCNGPAHVGTRFASGGPPVAGFRLALSSDAAVYDRDEPQWLITRMTAESGAQQFLTTNLPAGDSIVLVRDMSGAGIRPSGKLVMISVVGVQSVSKSCPLYERFDLRSIFTLAPGDYSIRVSRLLRRSTTDRTSFGTAISNEIVVRIRE